MSIAAAPSTAALVTTAPSTVICSRSPVTVPSIASGVVGGALTAAPPPSRGAALTVPAGALRADVALFGEGPTRVIVTCAPGDAAALATHVAAAGLPLTILGTVAGDRLQVTVEGAAATGAAAIDLPVTELQRSYESLPDRLA